MDEHWDERDEKKGRAERKDEQRGTRKGDKISLRMKKIKGMSKEGDEERGRMNREKEGGSTGEG
jgi:hypothetical protein